jgi:hypothetical protein
MSDNLKKFIQESKSKFDLESPRPDLFDKIMKDVDHNQKKHLLKPFSSNGIKWMAVAATIVLLIVSTFYFYPANDHVQNPTQELSSVQNQGDNTREKISSELLANSESTLASHENSTIQNDIPRQSKIQSQKEQLIKTADPDTKNLQVEQELTKIEPLTKQIPEPKQSDSIPEPVVVTQSSAPVSENIMPTNALQKVSILSESSIVSATTTDTLHEKVASTIKEQSPIANTENSNDESIEENESEQNSSLAKTIKKGFFKFLSKKAKKWSGNTLTIRNVETEDQSILALRYKNERVEFSKSFNLRTKE